MSDAISLAVLILGIAIPAILLAGGTLAVILCILADLRDMRRWWR